MSTYKTQAERMMDLHHPPIVADPPMSTPKDTEQAVDPLDASQLNNPITVQYGLPPEVKAERDKAKESTLMTPEVLEEIRGIVSDDRFVNRTPSEQWAFNRLLHDAEEAHRLQQRNERLQAAVKAAVAWFSCRDAANARKLEQALREVQE